MKKTLASKVKNRYVIHKHKIKYSLKLQWYQILLKLGKFDNNDEIEKLTFDKEWEYRISIALKSEYNKFIPRVSNAGNINKGFQTMHNGLQISTGDYYGLPITKMLHLNKGVHEPEEEKMFLDVINKMPEDPVMIEMGAYWAFYSMWFLKATVRGKVYMIEPDLKNIAVGMKNLNKNNLTGTIDNYFIGKSSTTDKGTSVICLDDYIEQKGIKHINIAHADIQGYEMELLQGATKCLGSKMADYFFVSTHTNELHYSCIDFLKNYGYKILFDVDLVKAASFDGFILAVSPNVK